MVMRQKEMILFLLYYLQGLRKYCTPGIFGRNDLMCAIEKNGIIKDEAESHTLSALQIKYLYYLCTQNISHSYIKENS